MITATKADTKVETKKRTEKSNPEQQYKEQYKEQQIEANKKFFGLYNEAHLKRGLQFYPDKHNDMACMATFPRSGSSLLLNIVENISGFFIGEDMPLKTSQEAIANGNVRASVDYVKIFRTHAPALTGSTWRIDAEIPCNRVAVLIRNPFRSLVSLFSMIVLNEHTKSLTREEHAARKTDFDLFISCASELFNSFCDYWTNQTQVPVLFLRYEDLKSDSVDFLTTLFSFLEGNDVTGSALHDKIKKYMKDKGLSSTFMKGQKSNNDQFSYLSADQIKQIYQVNKKWFHFFDWNSDIRQEVGNCVTVEPDDETTGEFRVRNTELMANLEQQQFDKKMFIKDRYSEFERRFLDPISPMYKFY